MRISMMNQPQDISKYETEIEETRIAKEEAISKQEYEKAAKLRDKEKKLRESLQQIYAPNGKSIKKSMKSLLKMKMWPTFSLNKPAFLSLA